MLVGNVARTRREIKVKLANLSQLAVFNFANLTLVRLSTKDILLVVPRNRAAVDDLGAIAKSNGSRPI